MQRKTISDFSGGIQESLSPDDFTDRQWARLKGFVPRDDVNFESQWSAQLVGNANSALTFTAVFPLISQVGTFLIALTTSGAIYWAKAPDEDAPWGPSNPSAPKKPAIDTVWNALTQAQNYGWSSTGASVSQISISSNADYRFVTSVPFEVYKYNLVPSTTGTNGQYLNQDSVPDTSNEDGGAVSSPAPRSIVSGVLLHSRRYYTAGAVSATSATQMAVVAYVNPNGNSGAGSVEACTFPNIRRWPTKSISGTSAPVDPYKPGAAAPGTVAFLTQYPYTGSPVGYPRITQAFHPYTYLDANKGLNPGSGIIPRGNVGTVWGNNLIIGDIEWKSDSANEASSKKVAPPANSAPLGGISGAVPFNYGLRDGNTEPHRGSFYYAEGDIDLFDPRSVIRTSGTDTRIAGMHMLDNKLIIVTTAGGENDGVIAWSGNLGQLRPYDPKVIANPFAVRKQIIRGGVGVADRVPDSGGGHIVQSCVWSELGIVIFVDRLGGVFYTNGQDCDRLDRYGPKQPRGSTYHDHPAAVGKHAVIWRDGRLLVFSVMESSANAASGCWTELVPPVDGLAPANLKSMYGSGRSLYMIVNGNVWRYALDAPASERGHRVAYDISTSTHVSSAVDLTVSTRTIGDLDASVKINWFNVGISFSTEATCYLKSVTVKAGPALQSTSPTPNPGTSQIINYQAFNPGSPRAYTNGFYEEVLVAGIGSQPQISVTAVFTGSLKLEAASFWYAGNTMKRGGTQ